MVVGGGGGEKERERERDIHPLDRGSRGADDAHEAVQTFKEVETFGCFFKDISDAALNEKKELFGVLGLGHQAIAHRQSGAKFAQIFEFHFLVGFIFLFQVHLKLLTKER